MRYLRRMLARAAMGIALAFAATAALADATQTATDRGVTIYYGVVPAEIVRQHPPSHPEATMHGGVPSGANQYHLVVAVFDADTKARINNAQVEAEIYPEGLPAAKLVLEPMQIEGTITYGGFFDGRGVDVHTIKLKVETPGRRNPATFVFQHADEGQ